MTTATSLEDDYAMPGVSTATAEEIVTASTTVIKGFVQLGMIEPIDSVLHSRKIMRIAQIQRLRRDLGLNLVGAAIVIDMAHEIAQLRTQLKVLQS